MRIPWLASYGAPERWIVGRESIPDPVADVNEQIEPMGLDHGGRDV